MNSLTVLSTLALLTALQLTTIPLASGNKGAGALYFMSNEKDHNSIVVSTIHPDGTLTDTKRVEIAGAKGAGGIADIHTANSVVVCDHGHLLFNVNYGSNSVTSHTIDAADPTTIKHASTVPSGGDKPTCLAVSHALKMLCVVNSGEVSKSGVFCLTVGADGKLTANKGAVTHFGHTTTPLPFAHGWGSPSDVQFTYKDKYLTVSFKGVPPHPDRGTHEPTPGHISHFPVHAGGQVGAPIINTFPNGTVPYAMNILNDAGTIIGYTDPGVGQYIIQEFGPDGKKKSSKGVDFPDQKNICWNLVSHRSKNLYVIEAADQKDKAYVLELSYTTSPLHVAHVGKIASSIVLLDMTIVPLPSADFIYVIHAEPPPDKGTKNGVFVVEIKGPKNMKVGPHYYPTNVKLTPSIIGMAHKMIK